MKTLTYETLAGGFVASQAKVIMRGGTWFWLCNPYPELKAAWEAGEVFEGHQIIAMNPSPVMLNPAHIASIEKMS